MKRFFAILAVVMLAACSSDDDKNDGPKKYPTAFRLGTEATAPWIQLRYDSNNNLTGLISEDEVQYSFAYNGNELVSITNGGDDEEPDYEFVYQDGALTGYIRNGETFPITYNKDSKTYIFEEEGLEVGLRGRDLGTGKLIGNTVNALDITYDDSRKGALYAVPTKDLFLIQLFANVYYYLSARPIVTVGDNEDSYTAENLYDADGYITQMTLKSGADTIATIQYQYSEAE